MSEAWVRRRGRDLLPPRRCARAGGVRTDPHWLLFHVGGLRGPRQGLRSRARVPREHRRRPRGIGPCYEKHVFIMFVANKNAERWGDEELLFPYPLAGEGNGEGGSGRAGACCGPGSVHCCSFVCFSFVAARRNLEPFGRASARSAAPGCSVGLLSPGLSYATRPGGFGDCRRRGCAGSDQGFPLVPSVSESDDFGEKKPARALAVTAARSGGPTFAASSPRPGRRPRCRPTRRPDAALAQGRRGFPRQRLRDDSSSRGRRSRSRGRRSCSSAGALRSASGGKGRAVTGRGTGARTRTRGSPPPRRGLPRSRRGGLLEGRSTGPTASTRRPPGGPTGDVWRDRTRALRGTG